MSGIAAIYHGDGRPVDETQIQRLVQGMAWRGGDQQGFWVQGSTGLGAVQLWTTPEDWGHAQPLCSPQGCTLALDGRLDNRDELGEALALPRGELPAWSDAALLLEAYRRWGEDCLDHLAGAFAFLLWDPSRGRLFAGRDPVGLRSLFYYWDGTSFYAASTLQQLRALPFVRPALNDDYLWDYLTTTFAGTFEVGATPFRDIRRLPGAHRLSVAGHTLQVERYWKPWELPPLVYRRDADYAEHFRAVFDPVVAAHCRARGPIAAALSGGLDSSSIVCVARQLEQAGQLPAEQLHTFTLVWEKTARSLTGYADGPFAQIVNERYGGPSHAVISDGITMFDRVPHRGPVPQDEPYFHLYATWQYLQQCVRQAGMRVLLTGVGADECLGGSLLFVVDWLRQGRIRQALRVLKGVTDVTPYSYGQIFLNLIVGGLAPRGLSYRLQQMQPRRVKLGMGGRYHVRIPSWVPDPQRLERRCLARHRLIPPNFSTISTQAQFEVSFLLTGDNARLWSDQYLGLAAGIDQRHPYLDRRLLEFLVRIPTVQKMGYWGERKYILRQAMAGDLPDAIRLRQGNTDYGYVFREGLNQHWPAFQALFQDSRAAAAGYIDAKAYLRELEAKRLGGGQAPDSDIAPTLGLEFWLREIEEPPVLPADRPVPALMAERAG